MFERFTEKARRVIFFARYEASQYGSPTIETEHLLLGLLREDGIFVLRLLKPHSTAAWFRSEIEETIQVNERISVAVEVPLSQDSKHALTLARSEADNLNSRRIGTEHLLLGILGIEHSVPARLLVERGASADALREALKNLPSPESSGGVVEIQRHYVPTDGKTGVEALEAFLIALTSGDARGVVSFFDDKSQIIDCEGRSCVGGKEIQSHAGDLFSPYAAKRVGRLIEDIRIVAGSFVLARILWENIGAGDRAQKNAHRMTIVMGFEDREWIIYTIQVTSISR
jgi:ketosteroid isomerase-like protein